MQIDSGEEATYNSHIQYHIGIFILYSHWISYRFEGFFLDLFSNMGLYYVLLCLFIMFMFLCIFYSVGCGSIDG